MFLVARHWRGHQIDAPTADIIATLEREWQSLLEEECTDVIKDAIFSRHFG